MMTAQVQSSLPRVEFEGGSVMVWMRVTKTVAISIFLSSVLLSSPIDRLTAQTKLGSAADSAAIKDSVATFIEDFNRHDAHAVAKFFADDADLTNVRGATTHGRSAIDDLYVTLFQGRLKSAQRKITVTKIRYLTPTIASVDGTWEMTDTRADDGSIIPFRHGMVVFVMTKVTTKPDGQWIITIYHEPEFPVKSEK
jgi:uncharacterized protein (TIGR02246 family)